MKLNIQKIKLDSELKFNGIQNPLSIEKKSCCGDCKGNGACNDEKKQKHKNDSDNEIVSQ